MPSLLSFSEIRFQASSKRVFARRREGVETSIGIRRCRRKRIGAVTTRERIEGSVCRGAGALAGERIECAVRCTIAGERAGSIGAGKGIRAGGAVARERIESRVAGSCAFIRAWECIEGSITAAATSAAEIVGCGLNRGWPRW